jgi:hypothetical protein
MSYDFEKDKKNYIGKGIFILTMVASLAYIINGALTRTNNEKMVLEGYEKTAGWIKKYFDRHGSDAGSGRTITYAYEVNGEIYSREIYTQIKYDDCDGEMQTNCLSRRFWVIYSKKDNSKSLISFKIDIQGLSNPRFPNSIKDFE